LTAGVGTAVEVTATEVLVELEVGAEVVDGAVEEVLDGMVTSEQVAPPVKMPHVPERALALLKSSV
jgi:hypothetical protein